MRIPENAKVNGEMVQKANGTIPVYRVKLVGGPSDGMVLLTLSNELSVNGSKYTLNDAGDFMFSGPGIS